MKKEFQPFIEVKIFHKVGYGYCNRNGLETSNNHSYNGKFHAQAYRHEVWKDLVTN